MQKSCSLTLIAAAILFAQAEPGRAADYDPPMIIEEAPLVPVEVGSGWYLRGDVSYSVNKSVYDVDTLADDIDNNRIGGSVGVGHHFTDLLRADINVAYIAGDDYDDGVIAAERRVWSGMVNGYLDLGTFVGLTPYVGAGAGLLYTSHEISGSDPFFTDAFSSIDRQYEFAYALNAGVSYQMTNNLSVDVGYQYLNSPGTKYVDVDRGTVEEGVDFHQVKMGLRYDLW
ncbi:MULTISPECIES: outer membrane protein [Chelativorans]|jgi:opacity protein-like surface antigen|uniref:Outer membrane protein beta-barrel domain-containing protein n=1 Tax=Chelativorans sp. (strain BNC1) TaxID=266779 RepID=Q11DI9_CHESB|nr:MULTISPECIES: outer membrane protein [Chelativorans]